MYLPILSSLTHLHMMMESLGMAVARWHNFIQVSQATLPRSSQCIHKVRYLPLYKSYFANEVLPIISRVIAIVPKLARLLKQSWTQYRIGQFLSEPYQHHQNLSERRIQDIKHSTNTVMDQTGTPSKFWLLATLFVVMLYNVMSLESIDNRTPTEVACGYIPDVSAFLHFRWWEPVYYLDDDGHFPSKTKEKRGRWVGISEHCGDALTWLILTDDTEKVIPRSVVRTAVDNNNPNLRATYRLSAIRPGTNHH